MALFSLAGISEALDNLNANEETLRGKLLQAIRSRFPDEESIDTITAIDSLDLIHELWAPQDEAEIAAKRKNLSSLKSSINKSLKEGIKSGKNPEGIIIGRDNVFIISDEKKNLLLDKLNLDSDGSGSLLNALAALNDMLAGMVTPDDKNAALKILNQLDSTRETLSRLAGLAEQDRDGGEAPAPEEADDQEEVEEFEVDDDTVIEFIDEEDIEAEPLPGAKADEIIAEVDDLLAAEADLEPGEVITAEELEDDWDSFEVVDDDFDFAAKGETAPEANAGAGEYELNEEDVEIVAEVDDLPAPAETALDGDLALEEKIARDGGESQEDIAAIAAGEAEEETSPTDRPAESTTAGRGGASTQGSGEGDDGGASPATEEADQQLAIEEFEIDDETIIEFVEEEITPESDTEGALQPAAPDSTTEQIEGLPYPGTGGTLGDNGGRGAELPAADAMANVGPEEGSADLTTAGGEAPKEDGSGDGAESYDEVVELGEDIEEIPDEELEELDLATEAGPLAEVDLEEGPPGGSGAEPEEEFADDFDSFEVVDDDFDILTRDELSSPPEEMEPEPLSEDDLEIIEEVEDLELAAEAGPLAEVDLEEGPPAISGAEAEEEFADDFDSFEVVDDDFDILTRDELSSPPEEMEPEPSSEDDLEIIEEVEDLLAAEVIELKPGEEIATEEVETEAIAAPPPEEPPIAAHEDASTMGSADGGEEGQDSTAEETLASDDWDSYKVVDDDDFAFAPPATPPKDQESATASQPLERSMDLSQYIEPEEALANIPDILQEKNDDYVRQILERFMPKFIKIPAGIYPVGGPQRRRADRAATKVRLPAFYIGQLPITNDVFDFFVRETGYETEAEQQGQGLVTSGRLRSGMQKTTGRHTLAITKGVMSRQIKGANWRHPDGPGSTLENRGHHPVVQVSRMDAMAFAAWAGKRLPSEDEWEAAARGLAGLLYPWGNDFLPLANLEGQQVGGTTPVNYFGRESLSPFGLLDMLGNVFEWTMSSYSSQNGKELSILKGGSWATAHANCAERLTEPSHTWANTIGFRCAVDGD